mmetsp:Transcript_138065/g.441048  ORF Transcript_138065/g.441048 Transcript_138065/m.441048 type:complete len:259 (+) Transcript_138065:2557-3333(+)
MRCVTVLGENMSFWPSCDSLRNSTPVVQNKILHFGPQTDTPRTLYPTTPSPTTSPNSSATRFATVMAAMRRGCVQMMRQGGPEAPRGAGYAASLLRASTISKMYAATWVVFPLPVSPCSNVTLLAATVCLIKSCLDQIGKSLMTILRLTLYKSSWLPATSSSGPNHDRRRRSEPPPFASADSSATAIAPAGLSKAAAASHPGKTGRLAGMHGSGLNSTPVGGLLFFISSAIAASVRVYRSCEFRVLLASVFTKESTCA